MSECVLVTGGAGFVGSFLVDELIARGHSVRIFDSLEAQVHGAERGRPGYLHPGAHFIEGDVRDREALKKAIQGVDVIFHLAAKVGVGQSMYEIIEYAEVNTVGGANLLDIIAKEKHRIRKVIVASSMSVYGEGAYSCKECGDVHPKLRPLEQLRAREWEARCPRCELPVDPVPTPETKPLFPTSIYAITKRDHEEMFLSTGLAYSIPTVALRYFNIYGPRQALSNPYTGAAAIFCGRLLNKKTPVIFEDGLQSRDFIHVSDIIQASLLAMEKHDADYDVFNVGTGRQTTILEVAEVLMKKLAPELHIQPKIERAFRQGDIRHCFADITKIQERLGFVPRIHFADGIDDLSRWVRDRQASDTFDLAHLDLKKRGLLT
jgi:dTDP-L-rhamnose 4-epimerase